MKTKTALIILFLISLFLYFLLFHTPKTKDEKKISENASVCKESLNNNKPKKDDSSLPPLTENPKSQQKDPIEIVNDSQISEDSTEIKIEENNKTENLPSPEQPTKKQQIEAPLPATPEPTPLPPPSDKPEKNSNEIVDSLEKKIETNIPQQKETPHSQMLPDELKNNSLNETKDANLISDDLKSDGQLPGQNHQKNETEQYQEPVSAKQETEPSKEAEDSDQNIAQIQETQRETKEKKCPQCESEVPLKESICMECGFSFKNAKACPSCHFFNYKDDEYCIKCLKPLSSTAADDQFSVYSTSGHFKIKKDLTREKNLLRWEQLKSKLVLQMDKKQYTEAQDTAESLLSLTEQLFPEQIEKKYFVLKNLASIHTAKGNDSKALSLLGDILELHLKNKVMNNDEFSILLKELIIIFRNKDKIEDTGLLDRTFHLIQEIISPSQPLHDPLSYLLLSEIYRIYDNRTQTEFYLKEALLLSKERYPDTHPTVLQILNHLGQFYISHKRYITAKEIYESVNPESSECPEFTQIINSIKQLASLLEEQDKKEALSLYQRYYEIIRQTKSPDDGEAIDILSRQAEIYKELDQPEAASKVYKIIYHDLKQTKGEFDPSLTKWTFILITTYINHGQFTLAFPLVQTALSIFENNPEFSFSETDKLSLSQSVIDLSFLLQVQNKFDVAEKLHTRALQILGEASENTIPLIENLIPFLEQQGKQKEAEQMKEKIASLS